jgi:hypothetical protein
MVPPAKYFLALSELPARAVTRLPIVVVLLLLPESSRDIHFPKTLSKVKMARTMFLSGNHSLALIEDFT